MKFWRRCGSWILLLWMACGCSTLKPPTTAPDLFRLEEENFSQINGEYEILAAGDSHIMLDYCLTGNQRFDLEKKPGPGYRIRLEAISSKQLLVTILGDQSAVKRKKLKGELNDGYYTFRLRKLRPYLLINFFNEQHVRLGLNQEHALVVQLLGSTTAFVLFVPVTGAKYDEEKLVFQRVK